MTKEEVNNFINEKIAPNHLFGDYVNDINLTTKLMEYLDKNFMENGFFPHSIDASYSPSGWQATFIHDGNVEHKVYNASTLSEALARALVKAYEHDIKYIKKLIVNMQKKLDNPAELNDREKQKCIKGLSMYKENLRILEVGEKNRSITPPTRGGACSITIRK